MRTAEGLRAPFLLSGSGVESTLKRGGGEGALKKRMGYITSVYC